MKTKGIPGIVLGLWLAFPFLLEGQALDPKLAPLEPLLGKTWSGMMKAPDGSAEWEIIVEYKLFGRGGVIKYSRTAPARQGLEEGYLYWDDIAGKIAHFAVDGGGVFATGYVTVDKNVVTFEGRMTWPAAPPNPGIKQAYDFRNTFEFLPGGGMVDRWFQNAFGPWRPGHVITFKARK